MAAVTLVAALIVSVLPAKPAHAAQITTRSLTLQAGATDGGSKPSGVVNHLYTFTLPSNSTVGSIKFEYCTIASGTCTTPTGLSTTSPGATLGASTGAVFTAITNPAANVSVVSRTAATATGALTVRLDSVTNPQTTNYTFFARISTYASEDATGSPTDTGTVAASTATPIVLTGTMPESLIFCTGATISTTSGIPDCTTATSGSIAFNQLFSPTSTTTATSQMAASTNAGTGYAITLRGPTLTSGGNTIAPMTTATSSTIGAGQFGMNLVENTGTPAGPIVGSNVAPAANGTNYKGQASTDFNTNGTYKFAANTDNAVAASNNGGAGPTDAQIFTASYIVNVSGSQPAGTYVSTLTYVCTATF